MNTNGPMLENHVALVTGGARNIGRATAEALSATGAAVVIHVNRSQDEAAALADEIEQAGGRAMWHAADLTREDEVRGLFAAVDDRFGRLDILVNNASLRAQTPAAELSLAAWREVQAVVVEGTFLCCREAHPLLARRGGTIVNIGGVAGHRGAVGRAHVAAAKAAVAGMTRALAREWAADGIRVNTVSPGVIDTARGPTAGALPPDYAADAGLLGRKGRPEEVAAMIVALCGPAGGYVTGQVIHTNGGMHMPG